MRIAKLLFLPLLCATASSAQSQTDISLSFEHDALTCMSTSEFPLVEAELQPAEVGALRKAQVYFKAGQTDTWYFVEMEPAEGSRLTAMLPKPLAETDRVDYYLFFLSSTFEPAQTEEYSVFVSETGCGTPPRTAGAPTSLTLRATVANQPPIPPGFSPQGISSLVTVSGNTVAAGSAAAGGGGVSGVAIGAAAGGAAAAGAVVVASGGDDEGGVIPAPDAGQEPGTGGTSPSPAPSPAPAPTPTPPSPPTTPSVPGVSGNWMIDDQVTASCDPQFLGRTNRTGMVIHQNGTALTATHNGPNYTENLSGTIDTMGNLTMSGPFTDEGEIGEANWEATTSNGSEMSGHYTRFYPEHDCIIRWRFRGSKQ